jgi:hypothetical protein
MILRDLQETDLEEIKKIYTDMNFDYEFPDLNSPLFVVKKVLTNDDGKIIGASVAKLQAELYLFLDQDSDVRVKVSAMNELNEEMAKESWKLGLDQLLAWIPPEIEKKFSKRLKAMKWIRSPWQNWTLNL